ncbi:hypothetical protein [Flavobacterium sp.]|uniref:hypothetical protein n=1 Tax=Flavobacterium sp. TaxID=239 RepID=UPI00286C31C1|nr:hypothetical protein [Flavobacterium sp.]
MGAWGTAISSNDTFADIYGDFFNLYNEGFDVAEISQKLISDNQETINDVDDCNNFWFALAKAQWECKLLDKEIFERVKKIIETGADIEVWKQLDADEKDIKKRKIVLDKFLADIQIERAKAKSRKKKIIRKPVFEKGDCLTFKLKNGNYGGAVVLEAIKNTELGLCLIATTRFNKSYKPTINDLENEEVLVKNFPLWKNQQEITWYYPISLKRDIIKPEVFGKLKVEIDYNPSDYSLGFSYGGSIDSTIEIIERQFEYEKTNLKTENKLTIKELTIKK